MNRVDQYHATLHAKVADDPNAAFEPLAAKALDAASALEAAKADAFEVEASLGRLQEAMSQVEGFHARFMAGLVDDTDRAFFEQLLAEQTAAGDAFGAAKDALDAALNRALAHDGGGEWI